MVFSPLDCNSRAISKRASLKCMVAEIVPIATANAVRGCRWARSGAGAGRESQPRSWTGYPAVLLGVEKPRFSASTSCLAVSLAAGQKHWKSKNVGGAGYIPLFLDANRLDGWPEAWDEPPTFDGEFNTEESAKEPSVLCSFVLVADKRISARELGRDVSVALRQEHPNGSGAAAVLCVQRLIAW